MGDVMNDSASVLLAGVLAAGAVPYLYFLGLSFSRGFHRGKKEFVTHMVNTCGGEERESHGQR